MVYDYVKLTGEKVGQNWAEYQAIGQKIDKLKAIAKEVDAPLLTAMQLNRSAVGDNKVDNSSAIASSDRLTWFGAFVAIFRRKTDDEILLDNEYDDNGNITYDAGTHKLIPVKNRFQGRDALGHITFMRRILPNGSHRYDDMYINFAIDNFKVEEKGSLRNLCARARENYLVEDNESGDSDGIL